METYKLIMPEHLNHYGYVFGGNLLKWVDEYAWIAATRDYPQCKFVTIGMDRVEFRRSIQNGAILRFSIQRTREGQSSVCYAVDVYADNIETGAEESVFATQITFVCLDGDGAKRPILA